MQTHKIGIIFTLILVLALGAIGYMYKDTLFTEKKVAPPLTQEQKQTVLESLTAPATTTTPMNKKEQEKVLQSLSAPVATSTKSNAPQMSEVEQQKILESLMAK